MALEVTFSFEGPQGGWDEVLYRNVTDETVQQALTAAQKLALERVLILSGDCSLDTIRVVNLNILGNSWPDNQTGIQLAPQTWPDTTAPIFCALLMRLVSSDGAKSRSLYLRGIPQAVYTAAATPPLFAITDAQYSQYLQAYITQVLGGPVGKQVSQWYIQTPKGGSNPNPLGTITSITPNPTTGLITWGVTTIPQPGQRIRILGLSGVNASGLNRDYTVASSNSTALTFATRWPTRWRPPYVWNIGSGVVWQIPSGTTRALANYAPVYNMVYERGMRRNTGALKGVQRGRARAEK
jgi:hypothetical protein